MTGIFFSYEKNGLFNMEINSGNKQVLGPLLNSIGIIKFTTVISVNGTC